MKKQLKITDPYSIRTKRGDKWSPKAFGQWQGTGMVEKQIKMLILSGVDEIEVEKDNVIIKRWER